MPTWGVWTVGTAEPFKASEWGYDMGKQYYGEVTLWNFIGWSKKENWKAVTGKPVKPMLVLQISDEN